VTNGVYDSCIDEVVFVFDLLPTILRRLHDAHKIGLIKIDCVDYDYLKNLLFKLGPRFSFPAL